MKEVSQVAKFVTVMVGSTSSSAVLIVFFFDAPTRLNSTAVLAQQGGTASVYFADAGGDLHCRHDFTRPKPPSR